ncbi:MAG: SusC/RagA family TonB-linked outer membrane protein [Prevotellaceae bacterium]|jgi:TonB-linked SusC/RagA family outer membrane protein|nr:SusC/RagA family TonB-linked outer membrane protein [Prevotellaceae bacterium]
MKHVDFYSIKRLNRIAIVLITIVFSASAIFAQNTRTITGKIVGENGGILPGAVVSQKAASEENVLPKAICDDNGFFTLVVSAETKQIEIACLGFESVTVDLTAATDYRITLTPDIENLEEVVVTGMFTRKANTFSGAVSTVTQADLLRAGNQNIIKSLKSLEPSLLQIDNLAMGSNPNVTPDLQMRGQSSFPDLRGEYQSNPNQPLFILDGFETELTKILDLDINIVESVSLLKDATAKAIYGAKAANGVIVVATKRPAAGKMRISYTGNLNVEIPDLSSYNLANADEKLEIELLSGLYDSDNVPERINRQNRYTSIRNEILAGVNTDWLAQPVKTGVGHKHSLYLEGGDKYMVYGVDLLYNQITGAMKGSNRNTFSGGVTLSYRLKNFMFRNKLSVTNNTSNESPWGTFDTYARMNPYNRLYDRNGLPVQTYNYANASGYIEPVSNPVWNSMINTKYLSGYTDITNNFQAEWQVLPSLRLVGRLGITRKLSSDDSFKPATHTDFAGYLSEEDLYRRGYYYQGKGSSTLLNGDIGVNYSAIAGKHALYFNAQANISGSSYDFSYLEAEGFPNDNMDHVIFASQYLKDGKPQGSESISHALGGVASLNYSFDERYLFDANYRLTGSSEFGANSRWGSFWSLGAGWNLHNESLFKDNDSFLNRLKLRVSTGYTGSQGFNTYAAQATVRYFVNTSYNGAIGSYLIGLANPDLHWQKKYDQNAGVDFAVLNNRITGRFDYYVATTEGMITNITLPESTGFSSYIENLGETENKGFETLVNFKILEDRNTHSYLNIYASVGHNTNKVRKISESLREYNSKQDEIKDQSDNSSVKTEQTSPSVRFEEGRSLSAIWAVKSLGIDPASGKEIFVKRNGEITYEYSAADQVVCGDALPQYNGNFGLNGEYKGFGLNIALSYRWGGQIYNQTLIDKVENADVKYNVDHRVFTDRWQRAGDVALYKSITDRSYTRPTSRFVEDNNILSLSSINVSYDFRNAGFLKKLRLQQLKAFVYFNDILTVSSVKIERGTLYPYARNFSFAIQASF